MYSESDLLPISGLTHLIYCERRCALVHIEQMWTENRFTAEGRILHEKTHREEDEQHANVKICRGLKLHNLALGIYGVADVVEFHYIKGSPNCLQEIIPVEYKRGKEKEDDCDRIQICAQALCLEEMLSRQVEKGYLFYGATRRRSEVLFDDGLRNKTRETIQRFHGLMQNAATPPAVHGKKCGACSLVNLCMPAMAGKKGKAMSYLNGIFEEAGDETSS